MLRGERTECLRISCRACYGLGLIEMQGRQHRQASAGMTEPEYIRPGTVFIEARGDARRSKIHVRVKPGIPDMPGW